MLKLAGESSIGLENIELLVYAPGVKDTGDLEAATKTITATSEASGLANADYSASLTLPKPDDARLAIKRICARLALTVDSMTAGTFHVRVYVDAQDEAHRLIDNYWNGAGEKLCAVDESSGTKFDLLSNGSAHTFYFYFWVDTGNMVLSLVQLWLGVGTCDTTAHEVMELSFEGFVGVSSRIQKQGTGSWTQQLTLSTSDPAGHAVIGGETGNYLYHAETLALVKTKEYLFLNATVGTDLIYVSGIMFVLRSEQ